MTTNLLDFVGNPDAFARQNPDGTYTPFRTKLDGSIIKAHLAKDDTFGTYVVWFDKARFFVFDIDDHDLATAKALREECAKRGLDAGIEFSGRKGFHVWVLFDGWSDAGDVQRLAKDIAATVGFNGEVFPKQAATRDLGSLVKLPLGKHAVTGNDSRFLVEPSLNSVSRLGPLVAALPQPAPKPASGGQLKCVDSIQSDPPKEGTRNNLFFHFACHMRRMGLHEEAITAALEELWVNPDPGEIDSVVLNSEFSGPTCDSVPADRHCGADCVKNRAKGLSLRPGQLRHGQEGELVVVKIGPHTDTQVLDIEHPDADQGKVHLA